eukprot:CAMPEP_0115565106 /NCGR_PEP_ID=MMETSP0271-20121206/102896_1 /TAXON_ID=71861 /ORGANISM="Scrippsiella trochoidea, Strain CCMP3099" /LENGTH=275 /DNA_ID=CAMNT_0002999369 /DNA_START=97 /DNA_END=924 /DNA_ORIENTATION=-
MSEFLWSRALAANTGTPACGIPACGPQATAALRPWFRCIGRRQSGLLACRSKVPGEAALRAASSPSEATESACGRKGKSCRRCERWLSSCISSCRNLRLVLSPSFTNPIFLPRGLRSAGPIPAAIDSKRLKFSRMLPLCERLKRGGATALTDLEAEVPLIPDAAVQRRGSIHASLTWKVGLLHRRSAPGGPEVACETAVKRSRGLASRGQRRGLPTRGLEVSMLRPAAPSQLSERPRSSPPPAGSSIDTDGFPALGLRAWASSKAGRLSASVDML